MLRSFETWRVMLVHASLRWACFPATRAVIDKGLPFIHTFVQLDVLRLALETPLP